MLSVNAEFFNFHTHSRQTSEFCCCCCFCRWAKVQFVVKFCMNFLKAHKFYKHTMCQHDLRGNLIGGGWWEGRRLGVSSILRTRHAKNQSTAGGVATAAKGQPAKNLCKFFNQRCERFVSLSCCRQGRKGWGVSNRRFCVCQAPLTTTTTRATTAAGIATMSVSRLQFARQQCESNQSQSSNTISQICTSMCSQLCVCECDASVCVWPSVCVCVYCALLRQLPGTFAILMPSLSNCLAVSPCLFLFLSVSLYLSLSLTLPP